MATRRRRSERRNPLRMAPALSPLESSIDLSFDPARLQLEVVHAALAASYWSPKIRKDVLAHAIANSLVVGAFDRADDRQVGFARVVTDRATFAWLCDVWVDEAARGQGVGKRMVAALIEHPALQTLRRWCLATKDAHTLYTRFGFAPVPAERWMELKLDLAAWQAQTSR
jgi:GNAT superfamily N-acetyltransferase